MHLSNSNNLEPKTFEPGLLPPNNGSATFDALEIHHLRDEIDSTCSTPYVSAPSSPCRGLSGFFFSAPASPMHFLLSTPSSKPAAFYSTDQSSNVSGPYEFDFSSNFSPNASIDNDSMISADELFLNGQIRPMKLSSHLRRPQILAPLLDLEAEGEDEENGNVKDFDCENREESVTTGRDLSSRNRSLHRKTRSMSPLRTEQFNWQDENVVAVEQEVASHGILELESSDENKQAGNTSIDTTPCSSSSSSRSSSSGRNSKKWIFLKDLLYMSKSEGRGNSKEKFGPSSLSPSSSRDEKEKNRMQAEKPMGSKQVPIKKSVAGKSANGASKRRVPASAHELHYTANRAQAEEMKKKTYLPYRQGLLGCLGFSSRGYGAFNGFTKTLNPVSSS